MLLKEYESAGEEFGRGVGDDDQEDMDEMMEKIKVGVCAMAKKVKSKPMEEILSRLRHHLYFEIIIFDQDMIVNRPITEWPRVDCLISFHSKDFPLSKAQEYAALYNPFLINDLDKQWDIMDRTKVYQTLSDAGIELPRYAIKWHGKDDNFVEQEDQIEIDGQLFTKPFVEKVIIEIMLRSKPILTIMFSSSRSMQTITIFIYIFLLRPVVGVSVYFAR